MSGLPILGRATGYVVTTRARTITHTLTRTTVRSIHTHTHKPNQTNEHKPNKRVNANQTNEHKPNKSRVCNAAYVCGMAVAVGGDGDCV